MADAPTLQDLAEDPARNPWLSLGLSLPLYGLVGSILLWHDATPAPPGLEQIPRNVLLDLGNFDPPDYASNPDPDASPLPIKTGGSHRLGHGFIDPTLVQLPSLDLIIEPPKRMGAPVDLTLPALERPLIVDKSLPVGQGGNGAPKGAGVGFGRGQGDGVGNGRGRRGSLLPLQLPRTLILLSHAKPLWAAQGEAKPLDGETVKVKLLVDAEGRPMEALAVSGRAPLHPAATRAAMDWRFQVPQGYADLAPFVVYIDFNYRLGERPSDKVQELEPVVLD